MLPRPYFCEKCHATFRTLSGREWHIAHQHYVPDSLESIRTEYSARTDKVIDENRALSSENEQMHFMQTVEKARVLKEQANAALQQGELLMENQRLQYDKSVAILALVLQATGGGQPITKMTEIVQGPDIITD
ncbi:hypothetical protein ACFL4C_04330 [Candidatus Omnitrophota bacterium]